MAAKGIEHYVEHYHQRAIQEQEPAVSGDCPRPQAPAAVNLRHATTRAGAWRQCAEEKIPRAKLLQRERQQQQKQAEQGAGVPGPLPPALARFTASGRYACSDDLERSAIWCLLQTPSNARLPTASAAAINKRVMNAQPARAVPVRFHNFTCWQLQHATESNKNQERWDIWIVTAVSFLIFRFSFHIYSIF